MIEHNGKTFDSVFDRGDARTIDGQRFIDCDFVNCGLSLTSQIERRSTVRNVELVNCRANGCHIGPAILEDVTIDGLQTNDLLILWGTVFRRVVIAGRIGKVKINHYVDAVDRSDGTQGPFDAFRNEVYSSIDWALDIRNAKFKEFEVRGIPARLIRRAPESQVVVTRERALQPGWREGLGGSNELWPFMIDLFLSDGDEDMVLVAPLGAPKKKRDTLLGQLQELRDVGVALPD